jgi:hypothetical protein
MPVALLKLLWMKSWASVRRALRVKGNPKRLVLLAVGVFATTAWLLPTFFMAPSVPAQSPDFIREYGPLLLLAFLILMLLSSGGDAAIAFQPAEVDLLFPGPFSRRQLLGYKLLSGMTGSLFTALIFSLAFHRHAGSWPAAIIGFVLAMWFIQFLGTALALGKQIVGELAFKRAVNLVLLAIIAGLAGAAYWSWKDGVFADLPSVVRAANRSFAGRWLLAPLRVFTSLMASRSAAELLRWTLYGAGLDALLVVCVLRLDADYLEASIRASERFAAKLRRVRSGNLFAPAARDGRPVRSRGVSRGPWLGGAAPIAWRQVTVLLRSGKLWMVRLLFILVFAGIFVAFVGRTATGAAVSAVGFSMMAYVTFALVTMLRFDFRSDLDHIETLKTLPLDPRAIALGELVLPVVLLGAVQAVLLGVCAWRFGWPPTVVAAGALGLATLDVVLVSIENLLFLLYPTRLANRGVADLSLFGRQALLKIGQFLVILLLGAAAAGAAFGVNALTGSRLAGAAVAWLILAGAAVGGVLAVGRAFRAFDVSSDMPA